MKQRSKIAPNEENIIPFVPDGDFYFTKGVEAFQKRKFEIAIKWLQKAVDANPTNPLYKCQLSIVYTEIGSYHIANELLNEVLETSGDQYTDCYYLLANNYAHLGLLNDAKKYAESYLDKDPDGDMREDAEHLIDLMMVDEEQEDDDWEFEEEDELLIYQETVFFHMEHQAWDKALPLLEEMMTLFPGRENIRHDYAYTLFFAGYRDDAIDMEYSLLAESPESLSSHINLAVFYHELHREEHKKHINALLNVYPIHEQQKLRIAVTFAQTGVHDEAFKRFRAINEEKVKNHLSYYKWYSITAYKLHMCSKALSIWKKGCRRHTELADESVPWITD
ncbi:hypothetical protein FH966_16115 [Lentibacillus cibarius]|uniref:Uncharacterized protein n=1 Tax=Lentibacillus cibarius TaxID=2583219 RepID=A0A549YMK2_9BACI|nr:hypothetical protein [Lentibacillus cibarius]TRM13111.1 hypothetical protein FH966_16115 [Lentibacillus cibarius]